MEVSLPEVLGLEAGLAGRGPGVEGHMPPGPPLKPQEPHHAEFSEPHAPKPRWPRIQLGGIDMGPILLWLVGIPIPIIILLILFWH
jgi:hypothetical protein